MSSEHDFDAGSHIGVDRPLGGESGDGERTVGQEVRVKVIKIENDGKRISLSMKDQEHDPE